MAMYYAQDVTLQMGPTACVAGSHYFMRSRSNRDRADLGLEAEWPAEPEETRMVVEAGTVVITHFELWHRATANRSDTARYMFKFPVVRMEEPTRPTWDFGGAGE